MSFWSDNPYIPTWTQVIDNWWSNKPPKCIELYNRPKITHQVPGCYISLSKTSIGISEFWSRWYSTKSRCVVPDHKIQENVLKGDWELWIAVRRDGELIGTVVRRWITGFKIKNAKWPRAAVIDYFCIHPAWRKKGVGRLLLGTMHNATPEPFPPHMILWEDTMQIKIPPISAGIYWSYRRTSANARATSTANAIEVFNDEAKKGWNECTRSISSNPSNTRVWKLGTSYIAIWDTFHRSIPDGGTIGIIMGYSQDSVIGEFMYQSHPWDILLIGQPFTVSMPEPWKRDSPFQWICYNVSTGLPMEWPCISL